MINIISEVLWISQIVAIFVYRCRKDYFSGKWRSLFVSIMYILVSDAVYYCILSTHGLRREGALMCVSGILCTVMTAIPFFAHRVLRDSDPLSEKVRRLTLSVSLVAIGGYLFCFFIPSDGKSLFDIGDMGAAYQSAWSIGQLDDLAP